MRDAPSNRVVERHVAKDDDFKWLCRCVLTSQSGAQRHCAVGWSHARNWGRCGHGL